jgi:hypothetical protein
MATPITGIIIYCSDPREEVSLWRRIKKHLIPSGTRMTGLGFLGAPICLAHPEDLPIEYALLTVKQIPFALKTFPEISSIIVVGHKCGYYKSIPSKENTTISGMEADIIKAAKLLKKRYPAYEVASFFANEESDGFTTL